MKKKNLNYMSSFVELRNRGKRAVAKVGMAIMIVIALFGSKLLQAQTVTEGLYYIASNGYNVDNTTTNYYLCPTENWFYFVSPKSYQSTDNGQPFMTTYQCRNGVYDSKEALWVVKQSPTSGYFYIIHLVDGKYLTYNQKMSSGNEGRMRIHLEAAADGDNALFSLSYNSTGSAYDFCTKNGGSRKYVNVTGQPGQGNQPSLQATNAKSDGPGSMNVGGIIGLWTAGANGDVNSKWYPESTLLSAPTINDVDPSTNRVTVIDNNGLTGYNIRYTTDGNDPTADSPTMPADGYFVEITGTIKVVLEKFGVVITSVASKYVEPLIPADPTFETSCDNRVSITCPNMSDVNIYYTITNDGSEPADPTSGSTLYSSPIQYTATTRIKAKAILSESSASGVSSFTSTGVHTAAPTITIAGSTVTITASGTIYYTEDGSVPTTSLSGHASPVNISIDPSLEVNIHAIAKAANEEASCVSRLLCPSQPVLAVTDGDCSTSSESNKVTITAPDDGRTLWYTYTPGENSAAPDPEETAYSRYTAPVSLNSLDGSNTYYTIHAYALSSDGQYKSSIVSQSHLMKVSGKPELTTPRGSNPVVHIAGGVFGDVAECKVDNGTPDNSGDDVTINLPLASDGTADFRILPEYVGTLTVKFTHGSWQSLCETTFAMAETPETPTWSMDCANILSLACNTPMADIHYTINESEVDAMEPTLDSPTYTPGCFDGLENNKYICAKAFVGYRASVRLGFLYQKTHSEVPQFFVDGTTVQITGPAGTHLYYTKSEGTGAGVAPTDPANPDIATPPAGQVHVTSNTTNINITGNNIITVFKVIAVPDGHPENASCMSRVVTREGYSITQASHLDKLAEHPNSYFFVFSDIEAGAYPTNTVESFAGVLDGNYHTISGLTKPLFNTITSSDETHNAAVLNLMLKGVNISTSGNAGAIANTATGYTRIYNCGVLPTGVTYREDGTISGFTGSSVGGGSNGKVGGLVGELNGTARVINCFSYANITSGKYRAGIVGYNDVASTSGNLQTMVMNCMFYGDIDISGTDITIAPVYGGQCIHNKRVNDNNTGLNNYCFFYYNGDYVTHIVDDQYHGSLGAEERFLNRFEFFRQTLNSTRKMAAFYVYGNVDDMNFIAKWVLDKNIVPFPVLKQQGYYPSVINPDAEHAVAIDPDNKNYNKGRKLGTLTVNIQMDDVNDTEQPFHHPGTGGDEAQITISQLTLNITDKDPDNFNFNYKKVQLPYYNQVGTKNYTGNRVVTGWKIVEVNGSTTGTGTFVNSGADYPAFNFADRTCSNKDLYSVSGLVFSQGAYWEVPDGVTSITIEPYWAKAAYLSDAYYDVTYSTSTKYGITVAGSCTTTFNDQTVYTTVTGTGSAIESLSIVAEKTVYDYAVVLVGNYHQYATNAIFSNTDNKAVTFMSADLDGDCEPDNTLFYYHNARKRVAPIRFDFLNMPGIGMVKRTWDSPVKPEPGIFKPSGWFEVTNTVNLYCGQFEYCDDNTQSMGKLFKAPLILLGGVYQQFVSSHEGNSPDMTDYIHVGGNAWFMNFANGCHTAHFYTAHNMPITVTGGDFDHFYLTGIYQPNGTPLVESAECYIDGGRFGEVAGAGIQKINGDVTWTVNAADIDMFFGGGINAAQSITGHITTTISNSRVAEYYGGPKFGDVQEGKLVTTTATDCTFGLFFGAGYGGTALNKVDYEDKSQKVDTYPWNDWVDSYYKRKYDGAAGHNGIATSYEYEYILHSDGEQTVGRFYIDYASLSLASTRDVTTSLTGCKIGKFYGGGRLGAVKGDVVSTLTDCIVEADAFGSGFSAESPKVTVFNIDYLTPAPTYNRRAGVFNNNIVQNPPSVEYTWKHANSVTAGNEFDENGGHFILTTEDLDNLGAVLGNATLTIQGSNTVVKGDVYGGGAKSNANTGNVGGKCTVNILGGTFGVKDGSTVSGGNIYGGGMGDLASLVTTEDPEHKDVAVTEDEVEVNIGSSEQDANSVVIYGSVYGCNNINGTPRGDATVHVWKTKHDADNVVTNLTGGHAISEVFGGGNKASYQPSLSSKKATVHVHNCDNTIKYVYGGGNAADVGSVDGVKSSVDVIIDGGRIEWLFGGGNGAGLNNPGANIYNDVNVTYHAGDVTYFFGGSNEKGVIGGSKNVEILNDNSCSITNHIAEFYGGNNKAPITGSVGATLSMPCTENPCKIDYLFGGSRMADISGDVTLTVYGGLYDYVFGGNNLSGTIDGNVTLNLYGGTINEAAFGGNKGGTFETVFYDGGSITGDITVNVEDYCPDCPLQVNNVFGAGDLAVYTAPTGDGARDYNPMVNVKNICSPKTITGNVYGAGNGDAGDESQEKGSVTGRPKVTIGDLTVGHEDYRAAISGNVFGGGNAAKVVGNTEVLMQQSNSTVGGDIYGGGALANTGSTIVTLDGGTVTHDIYGGGLGDNTHAAVVDGTAQVTVNGGTVRDVFGCNNINGAPTGAVVVDINGNVTHNVYGGGNQAPYAGVPDVNINSGVVSGSVFGGGNQAGVAGGDVTMIGGQVLTGIYGGCNTSGTVSGDIAVNINAGTVGADADHKANIHGGGYGASTATTGDVVVNIAQTDAVEGPIIWGDVYGGSALGNVNAADKHTTVTLNKGTINGDIYGGGLGDNAHAAAVNGAVQVTVNSGTVAGSVYGCNNVNGAPQSTVNVDIYGTDAPPSGYALGHVFGGGDQAAYGGTPVVKVHNCNNSIEYVYGGGNAANVLATDVTIYGGNTIGNVFGGCYGANVTSGGTNVKIHGGTIAKVFGGNNQSGTIAGDILVNVDKQAEGSDPACAMKIDELYGGGNVAASSHGTITIGCTGTLVDLGNNEHYGVDQEGIHYVYGGANAANITDGISLNITSGIVENVFGGNNASGSISGTIQVNINKNDGAACAADWYVGNVFGAGNLAAYTGNPTVNITNGHVSNDVYGGGLGSTAVVTGAPVVTINGGSVGNDVFGGGSEAAVNGATHVIVNSGSVGKDVYGGGALANTGATTVDIMGGTISGDIYGGGLGDNTHAPNETGAVVVNIGSGTPSTAQNGEDGENFSGNATIRGSVYGCNNTAGTPQDDVTVNVYRTAHTEFDILDGTEYAIANVFGGGNRADYVPAAGKMSKVNIYGCYNTIDRVFGGGNAAATHQVETDIQGGRLHQVFGGGNGEVTAANINGDVTLRIHGGYVEQFYGASNQQGTISGSITTLVDDQGPCGSLNIVEFFCGGNFADVGHDITTTILCSENKHVKYLYGGCNQANVEGNVQLNLYGGTYEYVFGGSKGRLAYPSTSHPEYTDINHQDAKSADITGNVTLNLYGGTITNVFGGSNVNGNINGIITVNVIDVEDPACPLYITNIYGGSNLTSYTPTDPNAVSPVVNVVHAKYGISGNVYGGSKGEEGFTTNVNANPRVNIGYDATSMDAYIPSEYITGHSALLSSPRAIISGNVFGGGDAARVAGNTEIFLRNRAKVFGNVYGGGNMGEVTGNTKVIVNGANE